MLLQQQCESQVFRIGSVCLAERWIKRLFALRSLGGVWLLDSQPLFIMRRDLYVDTPSSQQESSYLWRRKQTGMVSFTSRCRYWLWRYWSRSAATAFQLEGSLIFYSHPNILKLNRWACLQLLLLWPSVFFIFFYSFNTEFGDLFKFHLIHFYISVNVKCCISIFLVFALQLYVVL